jgi:hypothetical protein
VLRKQTCAIQQESSVLQKQVYKVGGNKNRSTPPENISVALSMDVSKN